MNTDIRISASFPMHPKTRKLYRRLGAPGVLSLVYLWLFVGQNRPEGNLDGFDAEDLALAAQWEGDPEQFVKALEEVGFLDRTDNGLSVHDWADNNPWAAGAKERAERARKAARARWEHRSPTPDQKPEECAAHAAGMQVASSSNAPSPFLSFPTSKDLPSPGGEALAGEEDTYTTNRKRVLKGQQLEWFERFWDVFAYKQGRAEAADAWIDLKVSERLLQDILAGAAREAKARPEIIKAGRTPKMAQGWLSGRRWEDEGDRVLRPGREPIRYQYEKY